MSAAIYHLLSALSSREILKKPDLIEATLIAALSVDETEVVRFLRLRGRFRAEVAYAIGPAPKAGRPRWMALTQLFEGSDSRLIVDKLLADPGFLRRFTPTLDSHGYLQLCPQE